MTTKRSRLINEFFKYKVLFLYIYDQPTTGETGGQFYGLALGHVFVGLYLQQLVLIFLFLLAEDENKNQAALPEGVLMIVLLFITVLVQATLSGAFHVSLIRNFCNFTNAFVASHQVSPIISSS